MATSGTGEIRVCDIDRCALVTTQFIGSQRYAGIENATDNKHVNCGVSAGAY